jgi:hypothetical protein
MKNKRLLITCALLLTAFFAGAQTVQSPPAADTDRGYIVKTGDLAPGRF